MKCIILLVALLISNMTFSSNRNRGDFGSLFETNRQTQQSTNLGPFAIGYEFCQNIQAITPILQAYSNVMWPVVGSPGFTVGIVQNESVIYKICDFLIKLEQLNTEGAIFHTARFLNDLTGKKWDQQLAQADLTWNIANSIYDFRGNGGFRQGALASAGTHRRLIGFADRTKQWFNGGKFDGKGEKIETKAIRQRKLNRVANMAYRRSILEEATRCPVPRGNKNLQNEYKKKVTPKEQTKRDTKREIQILRRTMLNMGKDFITDISKLNLYTTRLDQLISAGYRYIPKDTNTNIKRTVPNPNKLNEDGTPSEDTESVKRTYQRVIVTRNPQIWTEFINDYVDDWETWITGQMFTTGTFGLLDGKKGRLEEKFKNYSYECSENRVINQMIIKDRNDPAYREELARRKVECRKNLKIREGQFKNLLEEYITRLDVQVRLFKNAQADIWTFESFYFGIRPIQQDRVGAAGRKEREKTLEANQNPQEECRPQFTASEMDKMQLELKNVELEVNQEIMQTAMQQLQMDEARAGSQLESNKKLKEDFDKVMRKNQDGGAIDKKIPIPVITP